MLAHTLFRFFAALSVAVITSASPSVLKLRQSIAPPRNWIDLGRAPSTHVIPLRIALPQHRFLELEQHLVEISDPFHERYGDHLSKEEVEALIAPHATSVDAVHEWLTGHGIQQESCDRSSAAIGSLCMYPLHRRKICLARWNRILTFEFRLWKHTQDGDVLIRTTEYSLPAHLDDHVELIQPTTAFHRAKGQRTSLHFSPTPAAALSPSSDAMITVPGSGVTVNATCNATITVSCLKQLYNADRYIPRATTKNTIGITGYLEQFANFEDLQKFYADQVPNAVNTSFDVALTNGGCYPPPPFLFEMIITGLWNFYEGGLNSQNISQAGEEADLDVQFGFGISSPTPGRYFSTGGRPQFTPDANTPTDTNEPYSNWLDFILAQKNIPQTISTSYGDDEQTVPKDLARRVCNGFAALGARGTSLLFSSGDGGVGDGNADPASQTCFTNDGKNQTKFLPGFPASCPYVTAVGGTVHIPEVAVNFSGGGFSNYFPRPDWQHRAVTKYLKSLPKGTYAGLFNHNGRAIPDVSAQAVNFRIFFRGHPAHVSGTSASSPSFAAFVALLNDARIAEGKSSLGFLNPLIYKLEGEGFNDITTGNAPGCGTPGFNATTGWDPVTGWGTPNFEKLKEIVLDC
ncbi:tripeptidyl peptidase A [Multifurca ochricompacta]|uniref:tripeptidyl-peptidase II n=1 Tax=Multifurca ochricompacta TaxID=376703 RepID=A0AAD4QMT2_9AGAM|nr:tripeptidyl peptidase A [Multifurca ochricompacta]